MNEQKRSFLLNTLSKFPISAEVHNFKNYTKWGKKNNLVSYLVSFLVSSAIKMSSGN